MYEMAVQSRGKWDLREGSGGGGSRGPRTKLCSLEEEELLKELIDRGIIQEVDGLPVETNTIGKTIGYGDRQGRSLSILLNLRTHNLLQTLSYTPYVCLPHLFLTTSLWSTHWNYFLSGILCFRKFLVPGCPLPAPHPGQNCSGVLNYRHCLLWRIVGNWLFLLCALFSRSQSP